LVAFFSVFFFSSRRRHTRSKRDWSSDVCSSDLTLALTVGFAAQLLLGVMSYLLPATIGGPRPAVKAGLTALDWAGPFRAALLNRSEERRVGKERSARRADEHADDRSLQPSAGLD